MRKSEPVTNPEVQPAETEQPLPKQTLGSIPYWDQERAFASFQSNVKLFEYVSLFWYVLRADGSVQKYPATKENPAIIAFAKQNDVKTLALVANLPAEDEAENDWDADRVARVIGDESARAKHIADLVALTERLGFDGINLDYEELKEAQREDFTTFVEELSQALHAKNKILGVALHPKVREGDPEYKNGSEAQDWKELSKHADHLYVMTYDEHWEDSEAGPIASIDWVEEVLNYAKKSIPREKLFAGIPQYGYDWNSAKARGLSFPEVQNLISQTAAKPIFDNTEKSHYFNYSASGKAHTVWYEESLSFAAKLDLFEEMKIPNLHIWRLGSEDPQIWPLLASYK